jgi:hypothetical protein
VVVSGLAKRVTSRVSPNGRSIQTGGLRLLLEDRSGEDRVPAQLHPLNGGEKMSSSAAIQTSPSQAWVPREELEGRGDCQVQLLRAALLA